MSKDDLKENQIKEVAKKLFQEKGFEGTRTREIAETAGVNSALLHYYFRNKETLFHIVMQESLYELFSFLKSIVNDHSTDLSVKIALIVNNYINVIKANPNLALFVMNELHTNSNKLLKEHLIPKDMLTSSYLFAQLKEQLEKKSIPISPMHIVLNIISLSIMPIIARPLLTYLYDVEGENISDLLEERRKLIPGWIKGMLQLEE